MPPRSCRQRVNDAVAVGRPVLELRPENREAVAEALAEFLAEILVECLDRQWAHLRGIAEASANAGPGAYSSEHEERASQGAER
jgi:hypothetical protein